MNAAGESGERTYGSIKLARKLSSQLLSRNETLPGALPIMACAICLIVAMLIGS